MITIPIRVTLSPRHLVSPEPQNPALIRFGCPRCGQHLSATRDQISMTAPCPICNGVVTVPIQSTLPPRPLPLPEPQNPALIRFGCPRCGRHLSTTRDQISMTASCPICNERDHSSDPKHLTSTTLFAAVSESAQDRHMGLGLQVIGLLLADCIGVIVGIPLRWTVVGAIVGIPLFIVGRRIATRTFICHCGNEMTKDTKICPTCGAYFP